MIRVSAFYPTTEGATVDMDYYVNKHIPMVISKLGPALKGVSVEEGLRGPGRNEPPAFTAMAHLLFDSFEAYRDAFIPHADEILADIANYTSITPVIQFSEVKLRA